MMMHIEVNIYQVEKLLEAQTELNKKLHYSQDMSNTLSKCLDIAIAHFKKMKKGESI